LVGYGEDGRIRVVNVEDESFMSKIGVIQDDILVSIDNIIIKSTRPIIFAALFFVAA
jgi:hypothetical protein